MHSLALSTSCTHCSHCGVCTVCGTGAAQPAAYGAMLTSAERLGLMRNATFCVCPPGDFPYMQVPYVTALPIYDYSYLCNGY